MTDTREKQTSSLIKYMILTSWQEDEDWSF